MVAHAIHYRVKAVFSHHELHGLFEQAVPQDIHEVAFVSFAQKIVDGAAGKEVFPVKQDFSGQFFDADVALGLGFQDAGIPAPFGGCAEFEHGGQFAGGPVGTVTVGLVDHEDIPDFQDAGFDGLDIVSQPRYHDHTGGMGGLDDVHLVLAHTDGLDDDDLHAQCIHDQCHVGG